MSWLLIPVLITMVIGVPLSVCLGLGTLVYLVVTQQLPMSVLYQRLYMGAANYPLIAIPFFIFAGDLMNRSGITTRLVEFAKIIFGRIKGGASIVLVFTGTVFAGLSGSATADTAALLKIMGPSMIKEGYGKNFTAALSACAGTLGPIIPPSALMIVYGATMNVSISGMFMGGILPGLLIAILLMGVAYYIGLKNEHPRTDIPFTFPRLFAGFKDAILALIMPVIILVGIRGGIFTPTEGGAIAVAYALAIGFLVYRTLTFKDLIDSAITSGITAAIIMLIVATSNPFGWVLSINRATEFIVELITNFTTNKFAILFLINAVLLIIGMVLEGAAIVILLGPILAPLAMSVGVDPVHFGVIFVINVCIGMVTPPVGVNLFVAIPMVNTNITDITKAVLPFLAALLIALMLITYIPKITLLLPTLF